MELDDWQIQLCCAIFVNFRQIKHLQNYIGTLVSLSVSGTPRRASAATARFPIGVTPNPD